MNEKDQDKTEKATTRLSKAIAKAFEYFPFGFDQLQYYRGWAVGPVFVARAPESDFTLALLASDPTVYKTNDNFSQKVDELLDAGKLENDNKEIVELSKSGHPMQRQKVSAKGGGYTETGPSKCTGRAFKINGSYAAELPWALFDLGRALKVATYKTRVHSDNSLDVIFGYDKEGKLVCALAPKILGEACQPNDPQ